MKIETLNKSIGIVLTVALAGGLMGGCGGNGDPAASNVTNTTFRTPGAQAPAPIVTKFTPETGAPGASVTITGQNFRTATSVKFNGVNAGFSIESATQIRATLPSAATSGVITVASGEAFGSSSTDFIVLPRSETKK